MNEERRGFGALAVAAVLAACVVLGGGAALYWARVLPRDLPDGHPPPGTYFAEERLVVVFEKNGDMQVRDVRPWERLVWCVEHPRQWWRE